MNEDTLMRRLEELAPFASRNEARRAFDATLRAMRRGMNEDEADWLAVALGPALSAPLLREGHMGELSVEELYRWTKRYTKLRKGVAVEQAQVVCRALAELLPQPDLERLARHLPELAPLLRTEPPPPRASRRGRQDRGEQGGIGEGAEHAHSLSRAREPHNDTHLASGHNQERDPRSLASVGHRGR
jgi:uncharacterized protein (DUF2267 family)